MPKANPRHSTQSPQLAALLLGHNERNRGSNSSSSDSSPSRSRSCRRHKRRRHSKRHHQDHNPLGAPLPSSTLHRGRKRAENTQRRSIAASSDWQGQIDKTQRLVSDLPSWLEAWNTFAAFRVQMFPDTALLTSHAPVSVHHLPAVLHRWSGCCPEVRQALQMHQRPDPTLGQPEGGPAGGTGAMQQLLPQWLSPMQLARRCATVSMLEGAIGPLSQAAEGLTLADPANTCPRTPPVATCMHELQQAMQGSLGCCQRRLYPCPLDTRRFPRRTARAVRAARYGDQPRFQAAGDGVPSMAYIRGGRAAQHLGGCAKSQICQLIGGIERICPLWIGPYCTPVMLVSTDGTAVRQTTQVPQLQQPLVQVELCASSEAVYCHLTSEGATGQTATTDIQVLNHAGPGSGGVFGSSTFDPGPFDTLRFP
eukprot:Em0007g1532a